MYFQILLIFNICYCLLIIYLMFGKVGLYATENGITFFRTAFLLAYLTKLIHQFTVLEREACLKCFEFAFWIIGD